MDGVHPTPSSSSAHNPLNTYPPTPSTMSVDPPTFRSQSMHDEYLLTYQTTVEGCAGGQRYGLNIQKERCLLKAGSSTAAYQKMIYFKTDNTIEQYNQLYSDASGVITIGEPQHIASIPSCKQDGNGYTGAEVVSNARLAKIRKSFQGLSLMKYTSEGCRQHTMESFYYMNAFQCAPYHDASGSLVHYSSMVTCSVKANGKLTYKIYNASDKLCHGEYRVVTVSSPFIDVSGSTKVSSVGPAGPVYTGLNGACKLNSDGYYYMADCVNMV